MKRTNSQDTMISVTPVKKSRKENISVPLIDQSTSDDDSTSTLSSVKSDHLSETETFTSSDQSSPIIDDDEEEDNSKKHEALIYTAQFFDFIGKRPFNHCKEDMTFSLDPTTTNTDQFRIYANNQRDEEIVLLSRELQYFVNNTVVTKHCAPWGESAILCGRSFVIKTKIFNSDGSVSSIIVTNQESPSVSYSLKPAFFVGWADDAIRSSYDSFSFV